MRARQVPVCVDGRLTASEGTGVASYARAMRDALAATGPAPLMLEDDQRGQFGARAPLSEVIGRRVRGTLHRRLLLTRDAQRLYSPDVFRLAHARFAGTGKVLILDAPGTPGIMHWTYPIPAWIRGWVNLYTIHDAIPLITPELSNVEPLSLARRIRALASVADRFLTVSDAARDEILRALQLPAALVSNCGTAVTALAHGPGQLPDGLIAQEYYLFCGLAERRKNLPRLIAAWRNSGTTRPLVLTGPDHDLAQAEAGLVLLPFQARPALVDLIRNARALLFPSLAEGFGGG